jgi:hypothetical protein
MTSSTSASHYQRTKYTLWGELNTITCTLPLAKSHQPDPTIGVLPKYEMGLPVDRLHTNLQERSAFLFHPQANNPLLTPSIICGKFPPRRVYFYKLRYKLNHLDRNRSKICFVTACASKQSENSRTSLNLTRGVPYSSRQWGILCLFNISI